MSLVVTKRGKQRLIINALTLEELELRLFVDDRRPQIKDTVKSFTELKGSGYIPIQLPIDQWRLASGSTLVSDVHTFGFTDAVKEVFGYLVVGVDSNVLIGAERFPDAPVEIRGPQDKIKISLVLM